MSKVWSFIIILSIVFAIFTGSANIVTNSIMLNSQKSVENVINLIGMMCFWSGIFKIFENTSILDKLSRKMSFIIRCIFDKSKLSKDAEKYISLNMASNILGIGNAATINGIKAMEELSKFSKEGVANNNMTKFVLINTASLQLIPTSMIALRTMYGSADPTKILIPVVIVTLIALFVGITLINILNKVCKEE